MSTLMLKTMIDQQIKERPIIFSGHMVRAILDGRKTQTRRVLKPQPPCDELGDTPFDGPDEYHESLLDRHGEEYPDPNISFGIYGIDGDWSIKCPYGKPGDRFWVREKLHLPRSASRITLEITDIDARKLKDLSIEDISEEGVDINVSWDSDDVIYAKWIELWDSINAKRGYGWDVNPWVWVVEFKRITPHRMSTLPDIPNLTQGVFWGTHNGER